MPILVLRDVQSSKLSRESGKVVLNHSERGCICFAISLEVLPEVSGRKRDRI